jgi:hypothetical protein
VSLSAGNWSGQATQKAARGSARLKRMLADERLGKELLKVALKKIDYKAERTKLWE